MAGGSDVDAIAKNIDWDAAAPYYDAYVKTDLDVPFFLRHAAAARGPVLELMCGTGRIALPMLEAGFDVTGVDSSSGLVACFRAKLARRGLSAKLLEGDVRALDLGRKFPLVFVGFHSFAELLGEADRLRAMSAIRAHVAPGGRFVLTLHNPIVRAANAHEDWRTMGTFALQSGRSVEVSSRWKVDHSRARVHGIQRYRELDEPGHCVNELSLPIVFDLVAPAEVRVLAERCAFRIAGVLGTYDGAELDEASSPFAIFEMVPS